jgi:hypothetical protein
MSLFDGKSFLDSFDAKENPVSNAIGSSISGLIDRNAQSKQNFYDNVLQRYAGIAPKARDAGLPLTDLFARTKQGLDLQKRSDEMMEALKERIKNGGSLDFLIQKDAFENDAPAFWDIRAKNQQYNNPNSKYDFGINYNMGK